MDLPLLFEAEIISQIDGPTLFATTLAFHKMAPSCDNGHAVAFAAVGPGVG